MESLEHKVHKELKDPKEPKVGLDPRDQLVNFTLVLNLTQFNALQSLVLVDHSQL